MAIITADHGNCEQMYDPITHGPHTAHTTGDATLHTVAGSSVGVTGAGQVTGSNGGALSVGTDGSATSKHVSVTNGGIIQKTAGTNLTVQGGAILVDGANSLVTAGTGATGVFTVAATGQAASTDLANPVTGNLSLEATAADAAAGRAALTLSHGGQAIGNLATTGALAVTADAADLNAPAANGSVTVTSGGLSAKAAANPGDFRGPDITAQPGRTYPAQAFNDALLALVFELELDCFGHTGLNSHACDVAFLFKNVREAFLYTRMRHRDRRLQGATGIADTS